MMKSLKTRIMKAIAEKWASEVFPKSYNDARKHNSGDGLADFVRIELEEGVGWDIIKDKKQLFQEIYHVIAMAQVDLERVIAAVGEVEKEEKP